MKKMKKVENKKAPQWKKLKPIELIKIQGGANGAIGRVGSVACNCYRER